jgi:hypothetical protein
MMVRSGDADKIARRFYYEPDLALQLWLEYNRHLLRLQRALPEDCVVLGHHHILSGYDFMPAVERSLSISGTKVPDITTIDPTALSEKRPGLFCSSDVLMAEVLETWNELERSDIAVNEGSDPLDLGPSLVHDPEWRQARAWMAEIQVPELYKQLKKQQADLKQQAELEEQLILAKSMQSLARKVSKPPFSLYFMNKKKYRKIIEVLLSR